MSHEKAVLTRLHMLRILEILEFVAKGQMPNTYVQAEAYAIVEILKPQLHAHLSQRGM